MLFKGLTKMNAHLELLRNQSNYPTLRFLNLLVFKIGFFIGCLYVIFPPAAYIYGQVEKDRQLSKLDKSDRIALEKAMSQVELEFGDLAKIVSLLFLYYILAFVYFVFIYCFFEVSSMFIDMADNFLYFGSSS